MVVFFSFRKLSFTPFFNFTFPPTTLIWTYPWISILPLSFLLCTVEDLIFIFILLIAYPSVSLKSTMLINISSHIPYNHTISLLHTYPQENMHPCKNWNINVHSSITHKSQKVETTQTSINGWKNKIWYIHSMKYNFTIKRNVLINAATQMNLENIMPGERNESQKVTHYMIP